LSSGLPSSHCPAARYKESLALAREEWENILLNAIFTEPDDQTPWWYHRFIVSWVKPCADVGDEMLLEYETLLFEMADSLRELLRLKKTMANWAMPSIGMKVRVRRANGLI